jgi:predicted DsbA family dithiol-disulfide isomerase
MHDLLIENSPDLGKGSLEGYARELGLDMGRFKADLDGMKHKAQIDADVQYAYDLDLYNTPTFFINGRTVVGNRPYEYLKKIVNEELKNAQ